MGNSTTVGMTGNGQYLITLPKTIAQAMRLVKGDRLEFLFDKGDVLIRKI
ncbi:AbrB/MazE/SpoVT family DNA-binding domain-containing protein [Thermodesulfobacteriota bacterium]